jgi:hypothetical protein
MNETLKRIGLELRRRYQDMLRRPMNWRMIDAFVRLEEVEESKGGKRNLDPRSKSDNPQATDNVVELKRPVNDGS